MAVNIWAKNEWPRVIKAWMYGIAELCGRSCCLNELWYQRNEADKRNLSLSKSSLVCLGQLQAVSPSGPAADWSEAQVWQRYGCVWSAGWEGVVVAFGGEQCKTEQVLPVSALTAVVLWKTPFASLPGFALYQGVLRTAHPVTSVALLAGTVCEQIVQTSLVASSACRERKCQPREQHELLGCYETSSSMLLWVRSAWISQWNKTISVWLIEYTSFCFRCCPVNAFKCYLHYFSEDTITWV